MIRMDMQHVLQAHITPPSAGERGFDRRGRSTLPDVAVAPVQHGRSCIGGALVPELLRSDGDGCRRGSPKVDLYVERGADSRDKREGRTV